MAKIKCGNCGIEFKDKFVKANEAGEKRCPKCHRVYDVLAVENSEDGRLPRPSKAGCEHRSAPRNDSEEGNDESK